MKAKEIIRILEKDGWIRIKSGNGHLQFKHPVKRGRVTVPYHGNHDLTKRTLKSIFIQAKLDL